MTIFITGSSRGLGFQLGRLFESCGGVVLYHRRKESVHFSAKNMLTADLLNKDELDKEVLELKSQNLNIEHLICNAGQSSYSKEVLSGFANIEKALFENVIVTSNTMHSVIRHHKESLKTITIIGSICGEEYIEGAPIEYGIAKSTLRALTKASAHYLSSFGIRCNMITPGNLLFDGSVWQRRLLEDSASVRAYLTEAVPDGAIGAPEDIFDALRYVISDSSNFLNGANIVVDGGQTKGW